MQRDIKKGELTTDKKALDRRVATRWNSDLTCIQAHIYFKKQVKQLMLDVPELEEDYLLSAEQWRLAKEMEEVLQVSVLQPV